MKIVCLIRGKPHHRYFVNTIHKHHGVALVVEERPEAAGRLQRLIGRRGLVGALQAFRHKAGGGRKHHELQAIFSNDWKRYARDLDVMKASNINDAAVVEALTRIGPDLILDHGTSIVRGQVLETSELCLNLHWGLSPYYRGTACTEWALINCDAHNIGVTIHELSKNIDGGGIVAQSRIKLEPVDTVSRINYRLTHAGTDLVVDIIHRLKDGERLSTRTQDLSVGFLYLKRHFGKHLRRQVQAIERSDKISDIIAKPARRAELPIVEL